MSKNNLILCMVVLIIGFIRIALIFTTPAQMELNLIDPNQIGYIGLLKNPIIQLLFCLSLIIMLAGFSFVLSKLGPQVSSLSIINNVIVALIIGLVFISMGILWSNWAYIQSGFATLISMLAYEAYNPQSAPDIGYFQWKYSLNPAKVIMSLLVIPMLIPLFYYLGKIRRNKKSLPK